MRLIFFSFWAPWRVQMRRMYEEALLFFCTQRGYIMKNVSSDQQLILVKFLRWALFFFLLHILTVSNLQPAIRLASRRLPAACRLPAAVFIECHICAVKWWSWRIVSARGFASIHGFALFVLTLRQWCDINFFSALEDVWLLYVKVTTTVFVIPFFSLSLSFMPSQYQRGQCTPHRTWTHSSVEPKIK